MVDDLGEEPGEPPPAPSAPSALPPNAVRVKSEALPADPDAPAAPPPSRNFRWPTGEEFAFPYESPGAAAAPLLADLSALIAHSLARDGLLLCAAKALAVIKRPTGPSTPAASLPLLRQSGLPTDLLSAFQPQDSQTGEDAVVEWLLKQLDSTPPERLGPILSKVPFRFRPSAPGFAALPDSGQVNPDLLRLQLTRAGYYAAPGDGGSLDITRQLLEKTNARLLVHAQERHAAALPSQMEGWPQLQSRVTLLVQDAPLSQWAQDSAKSGRMPDGRPAALVPRFASRGEEASQLVIGDSCIAEALAAAGHTVVRSPLLFQGGNLLVVQEPSGTRTLLVGEAEVHRNRALGLSHDQVLAALATELGADRTAVLPAASIHLDYEVSVRTHGGSVVALVNDTKAALPIMLTACVGALADAAVLSASQARDARAHLEASRFAPLLGMLWPLLTSPTRPPGCFPLSLARHFQHGEADSGVGNFLRFLAALDVSAALSKPVAATPDPYLSAYLRAMERQEQDRAVIRERLLSLGWTVHAVPSFSLGDRSLNALNGIHTPSAFFMPAYGGLFAPLDAAAADSIARAFNGQVKVIPIPSGESQRRDGAVHCSASVMSGR